MNRKDILQILRRADGIIDVPAGTPEDEVQSILAEKEQKTAPQVPITPEDLANIQAGKPAEQTPGQEGTSEEVSSALQQIAAHIGQARTAEAAGNWAEDLGILSRFEGTPQQAFFQNLARQLSSAAITILRGNQFIIQPTSGPEFSLSGSQLIPKLLSNPGSFNGAKVTKVTGNQPPAAKQILSNLLRVGAPFPTMEIIGIGRTDTSAGGYQGIPEELLLMPQWMWPEKYRTDPLALKDYLDKKQKEQKPVTKEVGKPKGKGPLNWLLNLFKKKQPSQPAQPSVPTAPSPTSYPNYRGALLNWRKEILLKIAADVQKGKSFDPMSLAETIFAMVKDGLKLSTATGYSVHDLNKEPEAITPATELTPTRGAEGYDFNLLLRGVPLASLDVRKLSRIQAAVQKRLAAYGGGKIELHPTEGGDLQIELSIPRPSGAVTQSLSELAAASRAVESQDVPVELRGGGDRSSAGELRKREFDNRKYKELIRAGIDKFVNGVTYAVHELSTLIDKQREAVQTVKNIESGTSGIGEQQLSKQLEEAKKYVSYPHVAMKEVRDLLRKIKNWILRVAAVDLKNVAGPEANTEREMKAINEFLQSKFDKGIDFVNNPEQSVQFLINRFQRTGQTADAVLENSYISDNFNKWLKFKSDVKSRQKEIELSNGQKLSFEEAAELVLTSNVPKKEKQPMSTSSASWDAPKYSRLERKIPELDTVIQRINQLLGTMTQSIGYMNMPSGNMAALLTKVKQGVKDPLALQAVQKIEKKEPLRSVEQHALYKAVTGTSTAPIFDALGNFTTQQFPMIFGFEKPQLINALQKGGVSESDQQKLSQNALQALETLRGYLNQYRSNPEALEGPSALEPFLKYFGGTSSTRTFDVSANPERVFLNLTAKYNALSYNINSVLSSLKGTATQETAGILTPEETQQLLSMSTSSIVSDTMTKNIEELQTAVKTLTEVKDQISTWLAQGLGKSMELLKAVNQFLAGVYEDISQVTKTGVALVLRLQVFPEEEAQTPELVRAFKDLGDFVTKLETQTKTSRVYRITILRKLAGK